METQYGCIRQHPGDNSVRITATTFVEKN